MESKPILSTNNQSGFASLPTPDNASIATEELNKKLNIFYKLNSLLQLIKKRYVLSFYMFFGFFVAFLMRANLSVAIVDMSKVVSITYDSTNSSNIKVRCVYLEIFKVNLSHYSVHIIGRKKSMVTYFTRLHSICILLWLYDNTNTCCYTNIKIWWKSIFWSWYRFMFVSYIAYTINSLYGTIRSNSFKSVRRFSSSKQIKF